MVTPMFTRYVFYFVFFFQSFFFSLWLVCFCSSIYYWYHVEGKNCEVRWRENILSTFITSVLKHSYAHMILTSFITSFSVLAETRVSNSSSCVNRANLKTCGTLRHGRINLHLLKLAHKLICVLLLARPLQITSWAPGLPCVDLVLLAIWAYWKIYSSYCVFAALKWFALTRADSRNVPSRWKFKPY